MALPNTNIGFGSQYTQLATGMGKGTMTGPNGQTYNANGTLATPSMGGNLGLGTLYDPNNRISGSVGAINKEFGAIGAQMFGAAKIDPKMIDLQQARQAQGALDPTNSMQRLLSGQIDNPYLQGLQQASVNTAMRGYGDAVDMVNTSVMPGIRSGAVGAGQYGSSRQGIAEGLVGQQLSRNARDLGIASMDAGTNLYGTAYGQAQDRMYNTASGLNNQAFQAGDNNANRDLMAQTSNASNDLATQKFNAEQQSKAGMFSTDLANRQRESNANIDLAMRGQDQSYNLGLRNNDLGFGQLDANINQQNFNNQLSGANFGLSMYDRLNANNAAGINAATNIKNTPLNYFNQFSSLANQYGKAGASGSSSTAMPGNPLVGAIGGYQFANSPGFRSSLGF